MAFKDQSDNRAVRYRGQDLVPTLTYKKGYTRTSYIRIPATIYSVFKFITRSLSHTSYSGQ